ncbi:MAG: hypothetical protein JSS69_05030 [Acidobacteria bacterium]|nr:hypothetical protein [Acidobacteriota bacterium]MBS1865263.1 hypothetical protein [Acidobacteriota bacterium]
MSAGSDVRKAAARAAMLVAAVFALTILLSAMPGHRVPVVDAQSAQESQGQSQSSMQGMDHSKMPQADPDEQASEKDAMAEMAHMHGPNQKMGLHMTMTATRPQTAEDAQRANEIVAQLKDGIEKYRDYHVALNDGFRIFLPNIPQPEYHFTSYANGFLAAVHFDPSRPTSLLYKKTATGYELVGAMYTMPKRSTEDELNKRVPLSIAPWHLHTNLCMPPQNERKSADWSKFGLKGSIATERACDAAGGRFRPSVFGWMVHIYPYESSPDKIFAMHHHD